MKHCLFFVVLLFPLFLFCQDTANYNKSLGKWYFVRKKENITWMFDGAYIQPVGYWAKKADPSEATYGYFFDAYSHGQKACHAYTGARLAITRKRMIARTQSGKLAHGYLFTPFSVALTFYNFDAGGNAPAVRFQNLVPFAQYDLNGGYVMSYKSGEHPEINAFITAGLICDDVSGTIKFREVKQSQNLQIKTVNYSYLAGGIVMSEGGSISFRRLSIGIEQHFSFASGIYFYSNGVVVNNHIVTDASYKFRAVMRADQILFSLRYMFKK